SWYVRADDRLVNQTRIVSDHFPDKCLKHGQLIGREPILWYQIPVIPIPLDLLIRKQMSGAQHRFLQLVGFVEGWTGPRRTVNWFRGARNAISRIKRWWDRAICSDRLDEFVMQCG